MLRKLDTKAVDILYNFLHNFICIDIDLSHANLNKSKNREWLSIKTEPTIWGNKLLVQFPRQ